MKPLERLLRTFVELHPEDAAHAFETLDTPAMVRLFKTLPLADAVALLERVSPHTTVPIIEALSIDRVRQLLSATAPRIASAILNQLEPEKRDEILGQMDDHLSRTLRELALYNDDTAGAIMDARVASLPIDLTARQAIAEIRRTPREVLHYLYVTQRDGTLIGVLNMRDLLLAPPGAPIESMVIRNVVSARDTMSSDDVVQLMKDRGFLALPIVDFEGRLIGVVKHAEALQAGQEAGFEDMQKSVGAGAEERALSPIRLVVRSRLPWLLVNLCAAFLASAVIGVFEATVAQVAVLAVLLPVVSNQGGNTGSQSLAVVMRGLALREILPGTRKRVIVKEILGGVVNGMVIATTAGLAVLVWRLVVRDPWPVALALGVVIGLAMIANMILAATAGAIIPLLLKRLGHDPAQSASIFLTTVTDGFGFAAFLGFAQLFLPWLLPSS